MHRITRRRLLCGAAAVALSIPAHAEFMGGRRALLNRLPQRNVVEVVGTQISSGNNGLGTLLASPQQTQNANFWNLIRATTVDAAAPAPDGSMTAAAVTETTDNNTHYVQNFFLKAASQITYTVACIVKAGLRSRAVLVLSQDASDGVYAVFDLVGGQIALSATAYGSNFSSPTGTTVKALTGGYYLCTFTATVGSAVSAVFVQVQGDAGSGLSAPANSYTGVTTSPAFYVAGLACANAAAGANVLANLVDDNPATWWEDYSPQAWAGVDLGAGNSAEFVGYLFTPESGDVASSWSVNAELGDPWLDFPLHMNGVQFTQPPKAVQASNDATFASGVMTLGTIPANKNFARYDLHERDFAPTSARAIRMFSPYGKLSQLHFLAVAGSTTNARPARPKVAPWGGLFPAGSAVVTLTSPTPFAKLYYTTDGTTPTTASTLYTGPFTLAISPSPLTLKVIAHDATATLSVPYSAVVSAQFTAGKIAPLQNWYDQNGVLVEAHGGNLIQVGGYIYWCGVSTNMVTLAITGATRQDYGINLYRCTANQNDPGYLKQWTKVGQILPQPMNGSLPWAALERAHIVFNANNNTFCLCAHVAHWDYSLSRCALAVSSNIESGWSWVNQNFDPSGHGFKDCCFYTNAAQTIGYLVYTGDNGSGGNLGVYITKMDPTFVTSAVATNIVASTGDREGLVLFDNGTNLFLISSNSYPYNSPATANVEYAEVNGLDPISPTWPSLTGGAVFSTEPPSGSYLRSQSAFVFKPAGKSNYILGCDLWDVDGANLYSSRQAWSPMTIAASTITATQPSSWDIGDLV